VAKILIMLYKKIDMKKLIIGLLLLLFLQIAKGQDIKETSELQRPLLIGVQFGGSLLMASSENSEKAMRSIGIPGSQAEAYYKQLKRGWNFSGDIYFVPNNFGFGVKYTFYSSGTSQDFIIRIPSTLPEYIYMGMDEKVFIHYFGPLFIFRQFLGRY